MSLQTHRGAVDMLAARSLQLNRFLKSDREFSEQHPPPSANFPRWCCGSPSLPRVAESGTSHRCAFTQRLHRIFDAFIFDSVEITNASSDQADILGGRRIINPHNIEMAGSFGATKAQRRDSRLLASINEADWNFHQSTTESGAHSIHPFPAKFIPQIPRQIIALLDLPSGSVVLDPFAGSGTTLLEAQAAGCHFVGVDLNPIAVLISRVKTGGPLPGAAALAARVAASALDRYRKGDFALPDLPRLDHWFEPQVTGAVTCLTEEIATVAVGEHLKDFLNLCLSAITVRVSNQESETRYAALSKGVDSTTVFRLFKKTAESIAEKLQRSETLFSNRQTTGLIIQADSRDIANLCLPPISVVITSPPYPNAFEYWLYNKYRMYWLGFDPIKVREREIGARPHYSGHSGNGIEHFLFEMALTFDGISHHLQHGAVVAIVVSSKCRIRGHVYDLPTLLQQRLAELSYSPLTHVNRRIPRNRKSFNPSIGSIESETILFMRWPGP